MVGACASCASDSGEGFITSPSHNPVVPVATVQNNDEIRSTIHKRYLPIHDDSVTGLPRSPLSSRGWALQEYILSRRTVRFECKEMIWECQQSRQYEFMKLSRVGHARKFQLNCGSDNQWNTVVDDYRSRSLTYSSDFLPALSGIVSRMQELGAGEYLAGLWRAQPVNELLWGFWSMMSVSISGKPCKFAKWIYSQPYRAPTWSWASLERYDYNGLDYEFDMLSHSRSLHSSVSIPSCRILSSSCGPRSHDKNGAVISGYVTIVGKLMEFVCWENALDGDPVLHLHDGRIQSLQGDVGLDISDAPFYLTEEKYKNTKLYGLCIIYRNFMGWFAWQGITLLKVNNAQKTYERVGACGRWEFSHMVTASEEPQSSE
jgi:hypothetical protein